MKVHPIIVSSTEFHLGEHVIIYDLDDDMHGKEGDDGGGGGGTSATTTTTTAFTVHLPESGDKAFSPSPSP